jgi:hypothetical protein
MRSPADTLLFPSLAEGFGLPPYEALAHGIAPDLRRSARAQVRFGLRMPFTWTQQDVYSWGATIKKRISGKLVGPRKRSAHWPEWQDHFERVSAALAELRD